MLEIYSIPSTISKFGRIILIQDPLFAIEYIDFSFWACRFSFYHTEKLELTPPQTL